MKRQVGWPLVVEGEVNLEDNLVFPDCGLSWKVTRALEEPIIIFNG